MSDDIRSTSGLRDRLAEEFGELLLADGFDHCLIGTCYTPGPGTRAVYDTELIIRSLVERQGSRPRAQAAHRFPSQGRAGPCQALRYDRCRKPEHQRAGQRLAR